jgi:hypothetical protein
METATSIYGLESKLGGQNEQEWLSEKGEVE